MSRPTQLTTHSLSPLFHSGWVRLPKNFSPAAAIQQGLCWQPDDTTLIATPALLNLAKSTATPGEAVALLVACDSAYRLPWLTLTAARLKDLGHRQQIDSLCQTIDTLGAASLALDRLVDTAQLKATGYTDLELNLFGAPADQPAAAPGIHRVLGATAPLVEAGKGQPAQILAPIDPEHPQNNWCAGRLLQTPAQTDPCDWVLSGQLFPLDDPEKKMDWVKANPWALLLAQLVFLVEYWASEGVGGLQLELPKENFSQYRNPLRVQVTVTLKSGREVECGSLGELSRRCVDALDMALVPQISTADLDQQLAGVIQQLLKYGIWQYVQKKRPCYEIGPTFSRDAYKLEGIVFKNQASFLAETLRNVAITWAQSLVEPEVAACA